jgi:hypothetical protein
LQEFARKVDTLKDRPCYPVTSASAIYQSFLIVLRGERESGCPGPPADCLRVTTGLRASGACVCLSGSSSTCHLPQRISNAPLSCAMQGERRCGWRRTLPVPCAYATSLWGGHGGDPGVGGLWYPA